MNNNNRKYLNNDESSQENLTLRYNSDEIENHFRFENRSLFGNFNVNAGVNLDYVTYTNRTFQKIFSEQAKEILYETDLNLFKWGVFATAGYESPDERFTASLGVRFDANTYSSKMNNPSLPFHLPQEQPDGASDGSDTVSQHPNQVRSDGGKIAVDCRSFQLHRVDKGQRIGNLLIYAAYQL